MWLVAYVAAITAVVLLLLRFRDATLKEMDTPEARAQWQAWRDAEPNQARQGPVERKPPAVSEPPALLLMRDHFGVMLAGAVLFSSLLFAAIAIATRGVLSTTRSGGDDKGATEH